MVAGNVDVRNCQETSTLGRLGPFLGRFHPMAVHLPVGVLLAASLAEILFLWVRAEWLSGASRFWCYLGYSRCWRSLVGLA